MAFLSELHYRDTIATQTGVPEYVEIALSPADMGRLSDFQIATYRSDGTLRDVLRLSDYPAEEDPATGWFIVHVATTLTATDHLGAASQPEAVALIDAGQVPPVQAFYDIAGGTTGIAALSGPAAGETSVTIAAATGQSIQFDVYGNRLDGPVSPGEAVICLTAGTMIETLDGARPVETLREGDLVITHDNGAQPLRMVHSRRIGRAQLQSDRRFWPVRIGKGALGFGLPERDLLVSQQHRMLFQHIRVSLMFGEEAVFVRAKSLSAGMDRIAIDCTLRDVTYFHLVFDRHEVIYAEGAPTESFHPGPEGLAALDPEARAELFAIFPELRTGCAGWQPDYQTLRSWELLAAVA